MKTFADFDIQVPAGATGQCYTTCPQCSEGRKKRNVRCLSVNIDRGFWNCHHCGWTGSLFSQDDKPKEYRRPEPRKPAPLPEDWMGYFAKRGIGPDVIEQFEMGFGEEFVPQLGDRRPCIYWPYYRGDELVNRKWRRHDLRDRYLFMEKGAERILFNLNSLREVTRAIVCEGETDCMSFRVAGFHAVVSVPNGAPAPNTARYESQFSFLESDEGLLRPLTDIVLAGDNDEAGHKLNVELARRLGVERCRVIQWPDDCKDANEVLVKKGPGVLEKLVVDAAPIPISGVVGIQDLRDSVFRLYDQGLLRGVSTGWASLDPFFTVLPGDLTLVGGIPGHGKTQWVSNLVVNLIGAYGWPVAICSPEHDSEEHVTRLAEQWYRLPFFTGWNLRMTPDDLASALAALDGHVDFIVGDDGVSLDDVLERAEALVFRRGLRVLVIDPWNQLEHLRPQFRSEVEYLSECLGKVRRFNRRTGCHTFIVAHPTKQEADRYGKYPVPGPYDLSGGAMWRNKADNILAVWRDQREKDEEDHLVDTSLVQIHAQKVRRKGVGRVGKINLRFELSTSTYRDPVAELQQNLAGVGD